MVFDKNLKVATVEARHLICIPDRRFEGSTEFFLIAKTDLPAFCTAVGTFLASPQNEPKGFILWKFNRYGETEGYNEYVASWVDPENIMDLEAPLVSLKAILGY